MKIYMEPANLNYFEALASYTRLRIINLLSEKDMNIKELAEALHVSSSIITKHVVKLESAGLITSNYLYKDGCRQKICSILHVSIEVLMPFNNNRANSGYNFYETAIPIGHFTDIFAVPPCGMANETQVLGFMDEPVHMLTPERSSAQILWIGEGYVEYLAPNYLEKNDRLLGIEISGEFGSEAPGYNDMWVSSMDVSLNGKYICSFSTPGDFGKVHGALTPDWWNNNQYGILIVIRIDEQGISVNGERKSSLNINDLDTHKDRWILRFETSKETAKNGGLSIFGEKYGNYAQHLLLRTYYQ